MNIFEGCFLLLVTHQGLQGRNAHVFVCLVGAEGVAKRVDAHAFADPGLFDVLGDDRLDDETFKDVPFLARNSVSSSKMISVARYRR
jgi:hypothetical protein